MEQKSSFRSQKITTGGCGCCCATIFGLIVLILMLSDKNKCDKAAPTALWLFVIYQGWMIVWSLVQIGLVFVLKPRLFTIIVGIINIINLVAGFALAIFIIFTFFKAGPDCNEHAKLIWVALLIVFIGAWLVAICGPIATCLGCIGIFGAFALDDDAFEAKQAAGGAGGLMAQLQSLSNRE